MPVFGQPNVERSVTSLPAGQTCRLFFCILNPGSRPQNHSCIRINSSFEHVSMTQIPLQFEGRNPAHHPGCIFMFCRQCQRPAFDVSVAQRAAALRSSPGRLLSFLRQEGKNQIGRLLYQGERAGSLSLSDLADARSAKARFGCA